MEELYKVKNGMIYIFLNSKIYPLIVIKKTIFNISDKIFAKIELEKDENIKVIINPHNKNDINKIIEEFYKELLNESLRYEINIETKNIRELIIGRALYTTCINTNKNISQLKENELATKKYEDFSENIEDSVDDIAVNWFEKYGKKG